MILTVQKSYNQVPPINRALVRKIIQNNFHKAPEEVFAEFDPTAFAAASLGQVHRATAKDGSPLAIKVQYPNMKATIRNDIQIVKTALRPMRDYDLFLPALEEIEERLLEETDYLQEAKNTQFFKDKLQLENVIVPNIFQ